MKREIGPEMMKELQQWRQAHQQASWSEIEHEVDRRLHEVHREIMEELTAEATLPTEMRCPICEQLMRPVGKRTRRVQSQRGPQVTLQRTYYHCLSCGTGFFPLG